MHLDLKARVDNPDAVRAKLEQRAQFIRSEEVQDIYFAPEDTPFEKIDFVRGPVFRLRIANGDYIVSTHQHLKTAEGAEQAHETSFMVSDGEAFRSFAGRLGYKPVIEKVKRSDLFTYGDISIDVTEVEELGTFVELELFPENPDVAEEPRLLAALTGLGIPKENIETELYVEILQHNRIQASMMETTETFVDTPAERDAS